MATVDYSGKTVTDEEVKTTIQAIADVLEKNIIVTSGDRNQPLDVGGKEKSLHLSKRAIDFHIEGLDDGTAYQQIKVYSYFIFSSKHSYEFIWHGPYTETSGQHLHIGRYGSATIGYVNCKKEGVTAAGKGSYPTEIKIPVVWGRDD
jgi:hypothetical protein